jgi:hypothetical protein
MPRHAGTHTPGPGKRPLVPVILALALCATGCGTPATADYAALSVYEPESGAYRLRYLSTPWRLGEPDGDAIQLTVRSNAERLSDDPAAPMVAPKYQLDVRLRGRAPAELVRSEQGAAIGRGEEVLAGPRPVTTDFGDEGVELVTRRIEIPQRYYRYVALSTLTGGSLWLRFEANPNLDAPEVDDMVLAVEVAPDDI